MGESVEKRSKGLTIVLVLLLLGLTAAIVVLFNKLNDTKEEAADVQELLETQREALEQDLSALQLQFGSLKTDNDSIKVLANEQQEKIEKLLQVNATNIQKIKLYQKELSTLREVLKTYIAQVDSLNQKNKVLVQENREVKSQLEVARSETIRLNEEKQDLNIKVQQASVLAISEIVASAVNDRGREIDRVGRVEMLKACFDIRKNNIVAAGEKAFYARFKDPDGNLLPHPDGVTFPFQGQNVGCSAVRIIDYENEDIPVCIFWYCGEKGLTTEGKYTVDIFVEGSLVGSGSFILKK